MDKEFLAELGLETDIIDKILEVNTGDIISIQNEFSKFKVSSAVDRALEQSKAKNLKAVSALLDMDKVVASEDGVHGIMEQIKALKTADDTKFLFENETSVKGALPGEKGVDDIKSLNLDSMSYEQLCEHFSDAGTFN